MKKIIIKWTIITFLLLIYSLNIYSQASVDVSLSAKYMPKENHYSTRKYGTRTGAFLQTPLFDHFTITSGLFLDIDGRLDKKIYTGIDTCHKSPYCHYFFIQDECLANKETGHYDFIYFNYVVPILFGYEFSNFPLDLKLGMTVKNTFFTYYNYKMPGICYNYFDRNNSLFSLLAAYNLSDYFDLYISADIPVNRIAYRYSYLSFGISYEIFKSRDKN